MSRDSTIFDRTVAEALRQAKLLFQPRVGRGSTTQPGLVPVSPNDPTKFLSGSAPPAWASVTVPFRRTTPVITTASLANLATENGNVAMPDTVAALLSIASDRSCWVRLYTSAAAQAADAARAFGTQPTAGTGVLAEFVHSGAQTIPTSPVPWLSNDEGPPQSRIFYTIQNRSGSASTVAVTLEYGSLK
jgi:hypothetical protein